jgi:NAD(P)-dependent dehydrogenase (short-subunit alcohol dehydrogenase family)
VTGAASGIGRATALAFAREGANVVVADIDHHGNRDTARMIEDLGGQALAVSCDVTRSEDVQAALTKTVERFGRMDYAFNNAGAEQQPKPTADITEEEWDRIITINLKGVFLWAGRVEDEQPEHGLAVKVWGMNSAGGAGGSRSR